MLLRWRNIFLLSFVNLQTGICCLNNRLQRLLYCIFFFFLWLGSRFYLRFRFVLPVLLLSLILRFSLTLSLFFFSFNLNFWFFFALSQSLYLIGMFRFFWFLDIIVVSLLYLGLFLFVFFALIKSHDFISSLVFISGCLFRLLFTFVQDLDSLSQKIVGEFFFWRSRNSRNRESICGLILNFISWSLRLDCLFNICRLCFRFFLFFFLRMCLFIILISHVIVLAGFGG